MADVLAGLPVRHGHFVLESGYHTDLWITLDALFLDPRALAPAVEALANRLRVHDVTAICGPLLGGAFLAQAVASSLNVRFYYTELDQRSPGTALFGARYRLATELEKTARSERFAVIDDVISAGSSVRASIAALERVGGTVVVVGALMLLGNAARQHFDEAHVPLVALSQRDFNLWNPVECPLCEAGVAVENPQQLD